jgi:hypothetical protein
VSYGVQTVQHLEFPLKKSCSSAIVEDIKAECDMDYSQSMAYFYFDFNDPKKQTLDDLCRSLITQLFEYSNDAFQTVYKLYASNKDGRSPPEAKAVENALHDILVAGTNRLYIVIDALDECPSRDGLLRWMKEVIALSPNHVSILTTSRREQDIVISLQDVALAAVNMEKAAVDADIRCHVVHQLETNERLRKWSPEVKKEIEDSLLSRAHGMCVNFRAYYNFCY